MASGQIDGMHYDRRQVRAASYMFGIAGSGPPLLLLHGFPQTHYCWRGIVPVLSRSHTVVAPDLRGYGGTTAPPGGPQGQGFTKREMADDLVDLMAAIGHERFAVVGHDRGARVAYRMALDHPEHIDRLAVLNVLTTLDQFERMGKGPSLGYWLWFLLAQPAPFPERLLLTNTRHVLRFIFDTWSHEPGAIDEQAFAIYLDALDEATIAAVCADYRASFWLDRHDDAADREMGRRITCPVLLIIGRDEAQLADAPAAWRPWVEELHTITLPAGHFIPEEATAELATALSEFLG